MLIIRPVTPSRNNASRPGRRGTILCQRCRRMKQGKRNPCVTDPGNPEGPCFPCVKAGLGNECGERTLPPKTAQQQLAITNRYNTKLQHEGNRGEQEILLASFQAEGLDLTGRIPSFASVPNPFSNPDLSIQRLSLQSLSDSNSNTTAFSPSGTASLAAHTFNESLGLSSEGVLRLLGISQQANIELIATIFALLYPSMDASTIRTVAAKAIVKLDEETQKETEQAATENIPDFMEPMGKCP